MEDVDIFKVLIMRDGQDPKELIEKININYFKQDSLHPIRIPERMLNNLLQNRKYSRNFFDDAYRYVHSYLIKEFFVEFKKSNYYSQSKDAIEWLSNYEQYPLSFIKIIYNIISDKLTSKRTFSVGDETCLKYFALKSSTISGLSSGSKEKYNI